MWDKIKRFLFTEDADRKTLRLLPGIIIVAVQWLLWYVIPAVVPEDEAVIAGSLGGMALALVVFAWWAFFSRAPRIERFGAIVVMIVAMVLASSLLDESIATGNMGMMFALYILPFLSLALVVWAVAARNLPVIPRRATMVATIVVVCGMWTLLRTDGITGHSGSMFSFRWSQTVEERFLSQLDDEPMVAPSAAATKKTEADWPGFRGLNRDAVARGLRIRTDWKASPPVEMWRRPVGPGCSSFAIRGELCYTQEQRGEFEAVTCYYLETGKPAWRHTDKARFWDSHAGAGPRGTPTLVDGRVYTLGGTGIVNVLDARTGEVVWSRDAVADNKVKIPTWGIARSTLVVGEQVIVAVKGNVASYDRATGEPRWAGDDNGRSYSSPHLVTIDGVRQVVHMNEVGAISYALADGAPLWNHEWEGEDRCVQPAMTADGDLLLFGGGLKMSVSRFAVSKGADGWKVEQRWLSKGLKPNHNDSIIHEGHVYGFTGARLACVDVKDGARKWKAGRYAGFTILLADQGLLLVVTEKGELALVEAKPGGHEELARMPAVDGKTWNVPALAGDILLIRNAKEMVAFRLPASSGAKTAME